MYKDGRYSIRIVIILVISQMTPHIDTSTISSHNLYSTFLPNVHCETQLHKLRYGLLIYPHLVYVTAFVHHLFPCID